MTKTRRAGFRKKRRRGGRKTVKRKGGKRRSRVTKRGGRRRSRGTKRSGGYYGNNNFDREQWTAAHKQWVAARQKEADGAIDYIH